MDKYLYNKLRRLHRPGRGKQMKAEILQQFLVTVSVKQVATFLDSFLRKNFKY